MNQVEIDFTALARRTDAQTSADAAKRATAFVASHEGKIYGALAHSERGLTIYDLERITGLDHVAVARRMKSLEARKLVTRQLITYSTKGRPVFESRDGCALWWKV